MSDQTQARKIIVYGYCSSTSGAFSGILLTEYGDYVGCTSSPTEAGLPTALRHHFLADFSGDHRLPLDSDFEYVPRPQVPTHAGLQRAIAAYMGQPVTPQMQSIDSAPKDGSPV